MQQLRDVYALAVCADGEVVSKTVVGFEAGINIPFLNWILVISMPRAHEGLLQD